MGNVGSVEKEDSLMMISSAHTLIKMMKSYQSKGKRANHWFIGQIAETNMMSSICVGGYSYMNAAA